jgi:hypothetical protein
MKMKFNANFAAFLFCSTLAIVDLCFGDTGVGMVCTGCALINIPFFLGDT